MKDGEINGKVKHVEGPNTYPSINTASLNPLTF